MKLGSKAGSGKRVVGEVWGETGHSSTAAPSGLLLLSPTPWTSAEAERSLPLMDISILKAWKNIFNRFALIFLWSFHSALPGWNREYATERTGANDKKYPLLSAFCVCWKITDFLGKYQEDICDWACSNEHELCCASKACCTFRWFHHFTIQLLW